MHTLERIYTIHTIFLSLFFLLLLFVYSVCFFCLFYMTISSDARRTFERNSDCIISMLLSQKKRPDIRYSASSDLCKLLSQDVQRRIREEQDLFTFQGDTPLLLVLDRKDDPVTPLLLQWTYQAMVHEVIGIENNRVDLKNVPEIRPELKEVVLTTQYDHFYKGSMFLNFGELVRKNIH